MSEALRIAIGKEAPKFVTCDTPSRYPVHTNEVPACIPFYIEWAFCIKTEQDCAPFLLPLLACMDRYTGEEKRIGIR